MMKIFILKVFFFFFFFFFFLHAWTSLVNVYYFFRFMTVSTVALHGLEPIVDQLNTYQNGYDPRVMFCTCSFIQITQYLTSDLLLTSHRLKVN